MSSSVGATTAGANLWMDTGSTWQSGRALCQVDVTADKQAWRSDMQGVIEDRMIVWMTAGNVVCSVAIVMKFRWTDS